MMYVSIQGEEVPALGFGTWQLSGEDCTRAVRHALDLGYRHIDTAQGYENEAEVGAAIAGADTPREDLFLTTKIWIGNLAPGEVEKTADDSLRRLRTDYVDLLLIHWPTEDMDLAATLEAMMRVKDAGKVRHLGVSNFTPPLLLEALRHAPIFSHQVEYHPYLAQDELLALAQEHDLMLTAYSPLAKGKVPSDKKLKEIGQRHGKSPVQVVLRWLLQQENVAAIPKAASAEHRRTNLEIFDFALSDDEMAEIGSLARDERVVDPAWAPW